MPYNIDIRHIKVANNRFLPEVIRMIGNGHSVTIPLKGYSMRPFLEDDRDKAILSEVEILNVGRTMAIGCVHCVVIYWHC